MSTSTAALLEKIKSERKTAQFDGLAVKKGCRDAFCQMVEDQSPLILYRNLLLWRLQDTSDVLKKYDIIPELRQGPTEAYPNSKFHRTAPDTLSNLISTHLEKLCMMLPAYFEDKPLLKDYFCNVGCANWFGRYLDADEQQRAATFLSQMMTFSGLTELVIHLTCNFTLHAHQFVKSIRDEYLLGLCEKDCDHIELLKTACKNSVPRLGASCLSVWTKILEKESEQEAVASGFVDQFLVPCVLLWTMLPNVQNVDLPKMLQKMGNKQEFFKDIRDEMLKRKGGGSLEPALGPVIQRAPNELWSSLDCFLVHDVQTYLVDTKQLEMEACRPDRPKDLLGEAFVVFFFLLKRLAGTTIDKEKVPGETPTMNEELQRWINECNLKGKDHIFSLPSVAAKDRELTEFDKFAIHKEIAKLEYNKKVKEIMRGKLPAYTILKSQSDEIHWQVVAVSYAYSKPFFLCPVNPKEFMTSLKELNVAATAKMLASVMIRCLEVTAKREGRKLHPRELERRTADCRKALQDRLTAVDQANVIRDIYLSVINKCNPSSDVVLPNDMPMFSYVLLKWLETYSCGQILAFLDTSPLEKLATQDVQHADRGDETISDLMAPIDRPIAFARYLITTITNSPRTGERILLLLQLAKMVRSIFKCYESAPERDVSGECSLAFELFFPPPEEGAGSDLKKDFAIALHQAQAAIADDKPFLFRRAFIPDEIWSALDDLSRWCG